MSAPAKQREDERADSTSGAVGHDIVVIGASAGGVEALSTIVSSLPGDLPAAVFVVLHLAPGAISVLPEILSRRGPLEAVHPADGAEIERGRLYVAPPDHHLLIAENIVRVSRGPKENGHRPAIDPLFRTAARTYGPQVVGAVLSGNLDDGTIGLREVGRHGGATIVQDPEDALYPSMPVHAIEEVRPDHILPVSEIPALIDRLVHEPVTPGRSEPVSDETMAGLLSGLICPECSGPLWELSESGIPRFQCRVGHSFITESLYAEQADAVESALWTAIRSLEERSALATRLAERLEARGAAGASQRFRENADEARAHANQIRRLVLDFEARADAGPVDSEIASAARRSSEERLQAGLTRNRRR